jgi:hypothetical protein
MALEERGSVREQDLDAVFRNLPGLDLPYCFDTEMLPDGA